MRITIALSVLLFSATSAIAADLPICSDEVQTKLPCMMSSADASRAFVEMMLHNPEGYKNADFKPILRAGLTISAFAKSAIRVIALDDSMDGKEHISARYDLVLNDCFGTDACGPGYVWTVFEKTISDRYSYESKFENHLALGMEVPAFNP